MHHTKGGGTRNAEYMRTSLRISSGGALACASFSASPASAASELARSRSRASISRMRALSAASRASSSFAISVSAWLPKEVREARERYEE